MLVTLRLSLADGREQLLSQEVASADETPLELLARIGKDGRIPLGDRESIPIDEIVEARFEPGPEPQRGPVWQEADAPLRDEDVAAALRENYDEPRS